MLSLATLVCSSLLLIAAPAAETPRMPKLAFEKYTLPNGLDVILHEDHSAPLVGVNVWYHAGSKNERPGRTGFAHLFEHMMFQGSLHYDKSYFRPLEQVGGKLNGSTAADRTNYWETVPANCLELALWMEADRMGFLLPAMTRAKLDNQRAVVKNERRQNFENRPYGLVYETILAALYPSDHPYSWPTIGAMTDLDRASQADIADFFGRYYHPSNASLCIAGDFDPADAKRWVAKYFGTLPGGPKVAPVKARPPELKGEKRVHMTDRVELSRLCIAWHSAPQFTADDAALGVLAHVLHSDKTSRLYHALVRQRGIAREVQVAQHGSEIAGVFLVMVTVMPRHTLAEAEAATLEEIRALQNDRPATAAEIARTVNTFESRFVRSLESIGGFGGRADRLNEYNVFTSDPGYLRKDFERYANVDPAAVTRVARKYLGPDRVVVEAKPGKELTFSPDVLAEAAAARERMAREIHEKPAAVEGFTGTRITPPQFSPEAYAALSELVTRTGMAMPHPTAAAPLRLPPIEHGRLSNGMKILLVQRHELPLVNLQIVFPVGRSQDPPGRPGLAAMTTAVWDEGTSHRSAEEISAQLAGIGASVSLSTDWETTTARLLTLKRHLGEALDIYADVLRNPVFPPREFNRQRTKALARLALVRDEPVQLASMAANELLYGPEHPFGQPECGNAKTLRGMSRNELWKFYMWQIRPEKAGLIAVGDVTMDGLTGQLERVLGGWKSATPPPPATPLPPLPAPRASRLVLIDQPGAPQSVITITLPGADRRGPDYYRLLVMNAIFGGQFSSRLNLNLREAKGYTYGARSSFEWRVHQAGPLVATASVQTRVTAAALAEFVKEFEGMAGRRPVTAAELEFSRNFIRRGYPAMFETPSQLAAQLETLFVYRLPDDFFQTVVPKVAAVQGDDVLAMARKYLKPDELTIVVVGDRAKIEADLRQLPLGKDLTIARFDDDFRLVPAP
jgi:zinc protease